MMSLSTVMRIIENWQPDTSITKHALESVYSYTNGKHLSDLILQFGHFLSGLIIREVNGVTNGKYAFLQDLQLTLNGQLDYLETRNKGFAPNANYYAYVKRLSQTNEVQKEMYRYIDMLYLALNRYVWFARKENQFKSTVRSITTKVSKTVSPVIAKIPEPVKKGIVRGFELGKDIVLFMAGTWYNVRNWYGYGNSTETTPQILKMGFPETSTVYKTPSLSPMLNFNTTTPFNQTAPVNSMGMSLAPQTIFNPTTPFNQTAPVNSMGMSLAPFNTTRK